MYYNNENDFVSALSSLSPTSAAAAGL